MFISYRLVKKMVFNMNLVLYLVVLNVPLTWCTLSQSDRKPKFQNKKKSANKTISEDSFLKKPLAKLIPTEIDTYKDVLKEHKAFSLSYLVRDFENDVLGYVTPWNSHGYDIAKLYLKKFNMISPVWFQLKPKNDKAEVQVHGKHDVDIFWLYYLIEESKNKTKIVPRVIFESWSYPSMMQLLTSRYAQENVAETLIKLAQQYQFSGFVIEIWSLLGGQMKRELTEMLIRLAKRLKKEDLALILVIPPSSYSDGRVGFFLRNDFKNLVNHVTAFSLMSYDYSNFQRPGPNSPVPWLLKCIKDLIPDNDDINRGKLLIGINFYGNDYSASSSNTVIGPQYIGLLERHKPEFIFDDESAEHYFTYTSNTNEHKVYYPTLYSIFVRIQVAKELHTGIAIWEIGQGLDYFYQLL